MNSIEIIHAPREIGYTWHAEQRSLSEVSEIGTVLNFCEKNEM